MSLKGFHIVFIIFSTLLALGVGASHESENFVDFTFVDFFASWASAGMPVLLWRERRKIDRAHGGGNLVPFGCGCVGIGWDRRIQFSSLAAWAHARRALSR